MEKVIFNSPKGKTVGENVGLEPGRIIWGYLTLKYAENIKDFTAKSRLARVTILYRRI